MGFLTSDRVYRLHRRLSRDMDSQRYTECFLTGVGFLGRRDTLSCRLGGGSFYLGCAPERWGIVRNHPQGGRPWSSSGFLSP